MASHSAIAGDPEGVAQTTADRASDDRASRSEQRTSTKGGASPTPPQTAKTLAEAPAAPPVPPVPKGPPPPPVPVAGLSQTQMNNAAAIVAAGKSLGVSKRAYVIAVACALQESNLLNLASTALPESYQYPHEGSGSDHDSVGLFQQRPSAGWGSVRNLMTPDYAAKAFYRVLVTIPGWASMALTFAAQAVQVSAYPYAYARHESRAQTIVNALA